MHNCVCPRDTSTRNSAIADKPRDAFVQRQWRGWPENTPLPIWVTMSNSVVCVYWVNGCRYINTGESQKMRSTGTSLFGDRRPGWPRDTRSSLTCVSTSKWWFCDKGCTDKWNGALGPHPWGGVVANHLKTSHTRSQCVKFGSSATKGVSINRKAPKNWGALGPHPLEMGRCWPPKTVTLPIRVNTWNLVVLRHSECINRREPPKLGVAWTLLPCGRGVDDPRNTPLSHLCQPAEFGRSGQTVRALLRRSAWKIWPSCPAFQDHSRSSEPTRIDPPPVTSY